MHKSLKHLKRENLKYKQIYKLFSGENPSVFLNVLPLETLDSLENNLNLAIDQIKLRKFIKDTNFNTTNDSFRNYFLDVLEQKASSYSANLENKRRIPCDLLAELEKTTKFKSPKNEKKENLKNLGGKLMRMMSSNEKNEENLLSNVSHLYEEKFEIENILD